VTEMVTGIDLIKEQIRIASGEVLTIKQQDVQLKGAAIECRINAEDPENNFIPSPGKIEQLNLPGGLGVRVDTHIYPGYSIVPYYDSMIAKIIAYGPDRATAVSIMRRAMDEFYVSPIKTTASLHSKILRNPLFLEGKVSTHFLEKIL